MSLPGKRSKYRNVKTVVDGITFDSKKEANRYCELKVMEKAGLIAALDYVKGKLRWPLQVNGQLICTYEADFSYWESVNGDKVKSRGNIIETADISSVRHVIEDVKGVKTAVYRLKKKLMRAIYGIEIKEV